LNHLLQPLPGVPVPVGDAALGAGTISYIGATPALHGAFTAASAASATELPVLISGESGVGKSLLAQVIHQHGRTAGQPMVTVSCNALDETLLATELFGRDALLSGGPVSGQVARAAGGTLVLDDVDDLSPTLVRQVERLLAERQYTPLGSSEPKPLLARVIGTAAQAPPSLAHHFAMEIVIPPLRTHLEDVPPLAAHFLQDDAAGRSLELDAEALAALREYEWPGNIRQLKHVVQRAAAVADGKTIGKHHLPAAVFGRSEQTPTIDASETSLATVERRHIREVWRKTGGHISDTADLLGIHRNTLRRKLEEYGITD
jgi:DNA-binding NtrC family response regulator